MAKKKPKDDEYVIKRYANRKLYDTVTRKFTSLDGLAGLLESGTRITVRDHDSGADRTNEVLAQVLGRRAKEGTGGSNLLADLLGSPTGLLGALSPGSSSRDEDDDATAEVIERQQAEIAELRSQVAQLTEAVSVLLQDKIDESVEPLPKKKKKKK